MFLPRANRGPSQYRMRRWNKWKAMSPHDLELYLYPICWSKSVHTYYEFNIYIYIKILSIIVYWFILIDFFRQLHFRLLLMNPPLRHFPALCLGLAASHFPPSTSTIWWVTMCRSRPALCRPFWLGWFQLAPNTCQSYDNIIQESYNKYLYWHHIKVFLHVHPPIIHLSIFILCLQYPSLSQVSW